MPRITVLQHHPAVPLDRFGPWLRDAGGDLDLVALHAGAPVPSPGELDDGLLIPGGRMDAYDDDRSPWMPAVRALLAEVAHAVPTLAICLGHQLLTAGLGGRVEVAAAVGPELGPTEIAFDAAAASDPVLGPALAATATDGPGRHSSSSQRWVNESHHDTVAELPPDAVPLAHSTNHLQAFRVGSALGVQFHPEASPALMREWTALGGQEDPDAVYEAARERDTEIAAFGRALAESFVATLR